MGAQPHTYALSERHKGDFAQLSGHLSLIVVCVCARPKVRAVEVTSRQCESAFGVKFDTAPWAPAMIAFQS
jgi:hypothetical protein